MKNFKFILSVLLLTVVLSGCSSANLKQKIQPTPTAKLLGKTKGVETKLKVITLNIDFGEGKIASYSGIETKETNVLNVLQKITKEKNIKLIVKQYSFGNLVEQIGDLKNTTDKAWIYFVNNKSGDVGADQKIIKSGDIIEWKYIKPMF